MAGFVSREAAWLATIPFAVQFLAAFVNMCLVERTGRKILFVGAHIGMLIALIVLGLGFYLSAVHSPAINHHITETYSNGTNITDCQFRSCHECISAVSVQCGFCYDVVDHGSCLPVSQNGSALGGRCSQESSLSISHFKLDKDFCPTQYSWVPILGLSLYLLSFGSGAGTIWIIIAEIFPLWARSTCSPIAIVTIWIFQTIASMTFLSMAEVIGVHGIFWLYAGCCLMAVIYTFIYLPETRGTSLEDVEKLFMSQSERSEL